MLLEKLKSVVDFDHSSDELLGFACGAVAVLWGVVEYRIREEERRWHRTTGGMEYRAVPYSGLTSLVELTKEYPEFSVFMDWLVRQRRRTAMYARDSVVSAAKPLFDKPENRSRSVSYLRRYIGEKLEKQAVDSAIIACCFMPLTMDNEEAILSVVRAAEASGMESQASAMLSSLGRLSGGWSTGIGEDQPELVRRRGVFLKMAADAGPGWLAAVLEDQAKGVDDMIAFLRKGDEDILSPRG